MHHVTTFVAGRRELLQVSVAGEPGVPIEAQARRAIERAVAEVEAAGLPAGHIVRSRLWARDSAARAAASDARLAVLAGPRRAASSSFIDPARLPAGVDMAIDLVALSSRAAHGAKVIREYAPPIAPPQLVVLDGLLVLSGDTDRSPGLERQMASIRAKLDATLEAGGGRWEQAISIAVYLSRQLPDGAGRRAFEACFPFTHCTRTFTHVDGYSNPEKLVEIEVTADLA
jgi:enamine deaminase RidA (YjgF/YER057c/UK114 family)